MERPLEKSCKLELLPFDDPEGKKVFWHSSAHVLGEASERRFGCDLCIGPPIDDGFYYEVGKEPGRSTFSADGFSRWPFLRKLRSNPPTISLLRQLSTVS